VTRRHKQLKVVHNLAMHRLLRIARPQRLQRSLSTSVRRLDAHAKPMLLGEGSGVGQVATEETQGTGLARLQLLGTMKGVDVFNEQPLDASRLGTLDDPIIVPSLVCFLDILYED
jgi:cytochrome c oxidase subunit 5b